MAINKRKILQAAQKSLQKGAFDKALKDYKTLLEADPKDVNLRLKVGDVYLKQGKSDEAVAAYKKVAERFMKDGFDAKAVALYKQITKIDPKRVDIYVPLAELYQRLGLISDAMGALQTAADAHNREGDKPAALELLRKMATLDPSNTTSRLKVAEMLRQEGMTSEALAEFEAVADELDRQEEVEGRVSVLQKILELEPDQGKALEAIGRSYLAQRKWSQGEEIGQKLVAEIAEFTVEGYEILVEAVEGLGRQGDLPDLYQAMAQALRERGDDARARELVQRYCGGGALSADGIDLPQNENPEESAAFDAAVGADGAFGDDELDDPGFVTDSGLRLGSPEVERDAIDGRRRSVASPEASNRDMPLPPIAGEGASSDHGEATDAPAPEGDPEQLIAEASVYLRYGKSDRAVESLRAALAQDPAHLVALEKLGEALHATGDSENAVRTWLRGAEAAAAVSDDAVVTALYARVAEVDPSAVPSADLPAAAESERAADAPIDESDARAAVDDDDEIEIEIDEASFDDEPESRAADTGSEMSRSEGGRDDDATEVELDDELDLDDEILVDESSEAAAGADASSEAGDASEVEVAAAAAEAATTDVELDLSDAELPAPTGEFLTDDPVNDELEDDVSQESEPADEPVFDEALSDELATDEPVSDESSSAAPSAQTAETEEPTFDDSLGDEFVTDDPADDLADLDDSFDPELLCESEALDRDVDPSESSDSDASVAAPPDPETCSSTTPQQIVEELEEGEFYLEQGMLDEAAEVYERILSVAPSHPQAMVRLGEIEDRRASDPSAAATTVEEPPVHDDDVTGELHASETPAAAVEVEPAEQDLAADGSDGDSDADTAAPETEADAADESVEEGDFDLAAELSDVFDDDQPSSGARGSVGTEDEGFEQVFAAFKAGVDKELGAQDYEARYDLGFAYKEMGLLEDAIGEFRVAMQDPERQLQSLHMMGVCALDLGRSEDAVAHFEQALAVAGLSDEQQMALRFDLGRGEAARGDRDRARVAWEAVIAVDPDFQDVSVRLAELDRQPPSEPEEESSGEALESFDDLIDEAAVEAPEVVEEYESFEDFMVEDDDEEEAPEALADGAPDESDERSVREGEIRSEGEEAGADVTEVAHVTAEETEEPILEVAEATSEESPSEPEPPDVPAASEPDPEPSTPKKRRRKKISFM